MSLLDEWKIFITNSGNFPVGHFANLFREHHTVEEIDDIYESIDKEGEAARRLQHFFEENTQRGYWRPREEKRGSKGTILENAAKLKEEARDILTNNGFAELAAEMDDLPILFIENSKHVEQATMRDDILHVDYVDFTSDIFRDSYLIQQRIMSELKEATYLLTTSLDVTRYLLAP